MIEDLEGATTEPARRRHVTVLSAAVAAVSLALLVTLIMPPSAHTEAPLTASPSPRASGGVTLTIISNPLANMRLDLSRIVVCADGTRLEPPYFVSVDDRNGQMFAGPYMGTDRAMPVTIRPPALASPARWDDRAGWATVSCATPALDTPLETLARD